MDRRGFLGKALGVGLAAVTTKLWLPPVSTALAQPERTVVLPPANGWFVESFSDPFAWRDDVSAHDYVTALDRAENARSLQSRYRGETTYDVSTYDDLPNEIFQFNPGDTVQVEFGPEKMRGVMVVDSIDCDYVTGRTRIRGIGVESFYGSRLNPPLATIKADRGTVTRSLRDRFPGFYS